MYFLTYRLADALPASALATLAAEHAQIERLITRGHPPTAVEADEISRIFHLKLDGYLDRGYGDCWLRRPDVAQLLIETWQLKDRERYELLAWCVMPNHVHIVCRLFEGRVLARVLHSWKSFTSLRANEIIGRSGTFWEREYHDRVIRDDRELRERVTYVLRNPERAGLRNWPYVWSAGEAW